MRGLTLERDKAIMVIMLLVIIIVFLFWSFGVNTAQAQLSSRTILYMHCKEWQDANCDPTAADHILINIEGESSPRTFSQLCAKEYNNDYNSWDDNAIKSCKTLCVGCPK
jgi:hypothetical protein